MWDGSSAGHCAESAYLRRPKCVRTHGPLVSPPLQAGTEKVSMEKEAEESTAIVAALAAVGGVCALAFELAAA